MFMTTIPFGKMLRQAPGDAYPSTVTMQGIRPHLDSVQKAFSTWITGLFLSPS
jgi:hypothetical protein